MVGDREGFGFVGVGGDDRQNGSEDFFLGDGVAGFDVGEDGGFDEPAVVEFVGPASTGGDAAASERPLSM